MLALTLGEGNTPLVSSVKIGAKLGLEHLFFKLESCNPSGSYKDRFVVGEVRRIIRLAKKICLATSSGNTGSSLSAYCARAGIPCITIVNSNVPTGKLTQMQALGTHVLLVENFITSVEVTVSVYATLSSVTADRGAALVVSAYRYCPEGMERVEFISLEIKQQSTVEIHHVFVPVGGGGLFSAVCRGFSKCEGLKPRVHAVQPRSLSEISLLKFIFLLSPVF